MEIFRGGEPTVNETYQELDNASSPEIPLGTLLLVPLGDHGQLNIGSTTVEGIEPSDRQLVKILGRNARATFDRVEREENLQRQTDQMELFNSILRHTSSTASR